MEAETDPTTDDRAPTTLERVHSFAAGQHSVISTQQIIECGGTRTWITRRARERRLVRVAPAVYRMPGVKDCFETRAMAAVLSARGRALVSHLGAAYLHGIGKKGVVPGLVDLTVERGHRPLGRTALRVHETLAMDLAAPVVRNLISVTGVARTILDCSTVAEDPLRMLDDACRLGVVTWPELWGAYLNHRARGRNLAVYRQILEKRDGNTSPGANFNRLMADMLTSNGVPEPVFEHRVVIGGHAYYLDLAWPDRMVCVECNDDGSHRTGKGFYRDPMKRNRCERAGWDYLEYTWFDTVEAPAEIVAQVRAALG